MWCNISQYSRVFSCKIYSENELWYNILKIFSKLLVNHALLVKLIKLNLYFIIVLLMNERDFH